MSQMPPSRRRESLTDRLIPSPLLVLCGVNGLVPYRPGLLPPGHPDAPFHAVPFHPALAQQPRAAKDQPRDMGREWPREHCGVCRGEVGVRIEPDVILDPVPCAWAFGGLAPIFSAYRHAITTPFVPETPDFLDHQTFCLWCESSSREVERRVQRQRGRAERRQAERDIAETARVQTDQAGSQYRASLDALWSDRNADNAVPAVLSEVERRRIWLGYQGNVRRHPASTEAEPTNRAAIGRAFLKAIGQEPDWTLILDRRGLPIGRYVWDEPARCWRESIPHTE
jgi:hypothetical protein